MKTSRFAALLVSAAFLAIVCSNVCLALERFESEEYKFSFRYPGDWARLDEEQAGSVLESKVGSLPRKPVTTWDNSRVSVGEILNLDTKDIERGRTFLFAWKNNAEDILADRYFTVSVENDFREADNKYKRELESEMVRLERVFDEYTVVESEIVKTGRYSDIDSVFLHTQGKKFFDREYDEKHFYIEYFVYAIPLGDRVIRLTFICEGVNATYVRENVIGPVINSFEEEKAEQANKKFESGEHGFSFEYPHNWLQFDSEEIIRLVNRFGPISLGFEDKAVSEGRVFFFAEKDIWNDIWAVSTLKVTVEEECPIIDETFKELRAAQEAREIEPVFREGKSVSEEESGGGAGDFKVNYSIREKGIVKVNDVSVFYMHARGKIPKERRDTGDATPGEYIPVDQFIYLIPLGDRAVKLTFTCDSGNADELKQALVDNMVIRSFKGARGKRPFNWALWATIGVGVLIAGLGALVFWLSKKKSQKMDKSLRKRTFQPTKFQPKRPTSGTRPPT